MREGIFILRTIKKSTIMLIIALGILISFLFYFPVLAKTGISNLRIVTEFNEETWEEGEAIQIIPKDIQEFYLLFDIQEAEYGTRVGYRTFYLDINEELNKEEESYLLYEEEEIGGIRFDNQTFPLGKHRITVLINGKDAESIEFEIKDLSAEGDRKAQASFGINQPIIWVLVIIFAFIPSLFWLWIYRRKDKYDPEPRKLIFKLFLLGMVAVGLAYGIEKGFSFIFGLDKEIYQELTLNFILVNSLFLFLIVGPTEELIKYFSAKKLVWESKYFNQVIDGIEYLVATALGFAFLENLLYFGEIALSSEKIFTLFKNFGFSISFATTAPYVFLIILFAGRFLLATLAHTAFSGTIGFYLGQARFDSANSKRLIRKGLFIAILGHGAYNFMLFVGLGQYSVILIIILVVLLFSQFKKRENILIYSNQQLNQQSPSSTYNSISQERIREALIYLKENKSKYPLESLKQALINGGYTQGEVKKAFLLLEKETAVVFEQNPN